MAYKIVAKNNKGEIVENVTINDYKMADVIKSVLSVKYPTIDITTLPSPFDSPL